MLSLKTPKEIKKALECCFNVSEQCSECPYYPVSCDLELIKDAREYIRQLEAERDTLAEGVHQIYRLAISVPLSKKQKEE